MRDFYALLRQSILDRGLSSETARGEAYAQARRAMVNRLWSYDPPLAEREIDHRIGQFDMAVRQIEEDVRAVFAEREAEAAAAVALDERDDGDAEDDADYPPVFGGAPGAADPEALQESGDEGTEAWEAPADRRRLIEERSRAVERALLGDDPPTESPHDPQIEDEEAAALPAPPAAETDAEDAADLADASWPEDLEPAGEYDAEPAEAPPDADRKRWTGIDLAALTAGLSAGVGRLLPPSETARVRMLVGIVAVLSVLFVGGLVWVLLPSPTPTATAEGGTAPATEITDIPAASDGPAPAPPGAALAVPNGFSLFDGRDPTVFASDPDNPVRFDGALARIGTSTASAGAKVIIGAGLSSRLAGEDVRVTLEARSARENGAGSMRFAYESGVAISHWQGVDLSSDFTPVELVWRVPSLRTNPEGDYVVIEPGLPGSGTAVEIRSVRIELVEE